MTILSIKIYANFRSKNLGGYDRNVLGSLSLNQYYHGESTWESFMQPKKQTVSYKKTKTKKNYPNRFN